MTDAVAPAVPAAIDTPERSLWSDVWYQFRHHRGAMLGVLIFALILFLVIAGPWIWNADPKFKPVPKTTIESRRYIERRFAMHRSIIELERWKPTAPKSVYRCQVVLKRGLLAFLDSSCETRVDLHSSK